MCMRLGKRRQKVFRILDPASKYISLSRLSDSCAKVRGHKLLTGNLQPHSFKICVIYL